MHALPRFVLAWLAGSPGRPLLPLFHRLAFALAAAALSAHAAPTAAEAWQALKEGNARFTAGSPLHTHQDAARRTEIAAGQAPFATVLTCSDSRVPAELLFDQGLGDIFVVRVAATSPTPSVGPRGPARPQPRPLPDTERRRAQRTSPH